MENLLTNLVGIPLPDRSIIWTCKTISSLTDGTARLCQAAPCFLFIRKWKKTMFFATTFSDFIRVFAANDIYDATNVPMFLKDIWKRPCMEKENIAES